MTHELTHFEKYCLHLRLGREMDMTRLGIGRAYADDVHGKRYEVQFITTFDGFTHWAWFPTEKRFHSIVTNHNILAPDDIPNANDYFKE